MKGKVMISDLHAKFAEKTWTDTFQLVRRCMEKPRAESKPCKPLVRTLQRLQEVCNVSSMNTMRSRLEMIAKQQGMGFHIADATCYLTADLFYVEVELLPCGGVEQVKVAPHGGSPVPSESLRQLLRLKNFSDFSMKLAGLFRQYNIPGDNKVKLKLFTSLQCLEKDLQLMSFLPRAPMDSHAQADVINNGRIGCLVSGKHDCPLTIQFYINPADVRHKSDSPFALTQMKDLEAGVQTAQVTVGVSDVNHKLPMASVLPHPPLLDLQGNPVFLPLNKVPNATLSACFLLKLQPAVPVSVSLVKKLREITDVTMLDADLQWAPLPQLLMRGSPGANDQEATLQDQDPVFTVSICSGAMHSYIFPGAAWGTPEHRRTAMDSIPFTHPAHVPAILELLRRQCAINTLLSSCIAPHPDGPAGSLCTLHFEVLLESDTSFSVTFQKPDTDTLAVLMVRISDCHQMTCSLFGAGKRNPCLEEHISTVMKRSMSIPVTLGALHSKLTEINSAPLSLSCLFTADTKNDRSARASTDPDSILTPSSQRAAVPERSFAVPDPSRYAMSVAQSELLPEINTSPAVSLYPFAPVGVFSYWMGYNGNLSHLI
ncbi:hypothetical protein Q5P01_004282 [Channa striata]|uniref:Mediator of RNA polymerase II transcription subunit 1 n=1 Tax=Channa striata TaxID=64152 RepID=A0AA88NL20_CHASR|nr:hypothetical protein Q5P01_004282 [Channa striata]